MSEFVHLPSERKESIKKGIHNWRCSGRNRSKRRYSRRNRRRSQLRKQRGKSRLMKQALRKIDLLSESSLHKVVIKKRKKVITTAINTKIQNILK